MAMPTSPQPAVRPATEQDCAAIATIYEHYVANSVATFDTVAPTEAEWVEKRRAIIEAGRPFVVAVDESDGVIGFSYLAEFRPRAAYAHTCEHTVYVTPGMEGRGVGRALLTAMLDAARDTDVREIIALIALPGDGSMALHRRFGFVEAGVLRRVGFKMDRWVDVALMQLSLAG